MEELLGVLLEMLIEVFGEIIIQGISAIISHFVSAVDQDEKYKNRLKNGIAFTFFGLSIALLIVSIIYKKTFLINMTVVYLFLLVISNLFKYINKNIWKKDFVNIILSWYRRIVHYTYPILLIIFGTLFLTNNTAIIWLNICSGVAIFVYLCIDIYKLNKFIKYRKRKIDIEEKNIWDNID